MDPRAIVRRLTPRQITTIVAVVAGCVALAIFYRHIDIDALHRRAEALNGPSVFAALTVLPLLGFPVSVLHAVAGARFGLELGIPLVALSILFQLLLSYLLVKLLPGFFQRRFEWLRQRLPKTTHGPVTLFTMLLPGVPYFAQLYVLPLVGVPLRIFLLYSLPIIVARSPAGVLFGDMSDHLTPARVSGFVAYTVTVTVACAWSFRRLQAKLKDRPPAADGRTPPASTRVAARARPSLRARSK